MVLLSGIETNGAAFVQDQLSAEVSGCWLSGEMPFKLTPLSLNDNRQKLHFLSSLRFVKFCLYLVNFTCFKTIEHHFRFGRNIKHIPFTITTR